MSCSQIAAVLFACSLALGQAQAQVEDDADRARSLKAQKVVREVNLSMAQARALEKRDLKKARDVLRQAKTLLEEDVDLPAPQRQELLRQVNRRLDDVDAFLAIQTKDDDPARQKLVREVIGNLFWAGALEMHDLPRARGVLWETRSLLRKDNTLPERQRQELLRQIDARLSEVEALLTANKKPGKITVKERALAMALNSKVSVDFNDTPFDEVIEFFEEKLGQRIEFGDSKNITIYTGAPVTLRNYHGTLGGVLRKVLRDRGLDYIQRDGVLHVIPAPRPDVPTRPILWTGPDVTRNPQEQSSPTTFRASSTSLNV